MSAREYLDGPSVLVNDLMAYESGEMNDPEVVQFFARLIRTGMAWSLQGHYGRTATTFLEQGFIDPDGEITERGQDAINQYWDENPGEDVLT